MQMLAKSAHSMVEHPHLHERLFRLRLCCARLPHPLRQHLPHEAAQAGAGHLFPAGPPHGPGLPPPLSGDPAHRPGRPGHRHPPGHPPLPRPGSAHHRHVLRLSLRGRRSAWFCREGRGKTALYFGVIFLLVMVFTGLSVSRARLIDLMQSGRRNEEMRERPCGGRAHLSGRGGSAGRRLRHAPHPGHAVYRPAILPHAGPGYSGDPAVFPVPVRLPAPGGEEPEKLYYKGLNMFVLRQFNSRIPPPTCP